MIYIKNTLLLAGCFLFLNYTLSAQNVGNNPNNNNNSPFGNGTNTNSPFGNNPFDENNIDSFKPKKWENIPAKVHYTIGDQENKLYVDSSLLTIHRKFPNDPYILYLGNYGTATYNADFNPDINLGPRLGYNIYNPYFHHLESTPFYHTTRPYSNFQYNLGGAQEQTVSLLHTQNITKLWNVAVQFRNVNSPGYYRNQFANYNGGMVSSNYKSHNQKYQFKGSLVFNKSRSDENGGIISDSFLTDKRIVDKSQIETNIPRLPNNNQRSMVLNSYQNVKLQIENIYKFGIADTLYNEDSTQITPRFTPRFGIKHQMNYGYENHKYEDKYPDANRYNFLGNTIAFNIGDTLKNNQSLHTIGNEFSFNGFIGKNDKQAIIQAGIANRIDILNENAIDSIASITYINNYLFGKLTKEARDPYQWSYGASAQFYFAGSAVGDFHVNAQIDKQIKNIGGFKVSFSQTLNEAPLAWKQFITNYYTINNSLNKQSTTNIGGSININKLGLTIAANNIIAGNYIYYDQDWKISQSDNIFNVVQLRALHHIQIGKFQFKTEALIQQATGNAPINIPLFIIKHISAYDEWIFDKKLHFNTGIDITYYTPYTTPGYIPYSNQFNYSNSSEKNSMIPDITLFLSFKVKRFRLYSSVDQVQQLVVKKNNMHFPLYPMQNTNIRFGLRWILYN